MENRIYCSLPEYNDYEIKAILESKNVDDLILLPLSVGEYHPDWKFAQNICVELSAHDDERVRANAALGLAYIARTKGSLEKHIVKPILHKLLYDCDEYRWRIVDAIEDINIFMNWKIADKARFRRL